MVCGSNPGGERRFFSSPTSYSMVTAVVFLGVKWPTCESNCGQPANAEVKNEKNEWRSTSVPLHRQGRLYLFVFVCMSVYIHA